MRGRKYYVHKVLVTVVAAMLLLTACSGARTNSGTTAAAGDSDNKKPLEPVKIGAVFPMTGGSAYYGQGYKRGMDLAMEQINKAGGVKNHPIELKVEDDKGTPVEGRNAAQKLISQDQVLGLIGAYNSTVTLAIKELATASKVVQLTPGSTTDAITLQASPYMFRNININSTQCIAMADYVADQLKLKKFVILADNSDYGRDGATVFTKEFASKGGQVLTTEYYKAGDKDFYALLTKVKSLNPEGVLISGYIAEGALIEKQAKELKFAPQFVAFGAFTTDKFIELAGDAAEGMVHISNFEPSVQYFPEAKDFIAAFKAKYNNEDPDQYGAYGYEAIQLFARAMELGGFTREGLKDGMTKIKDVKTILGNVTFDQNGQAFRKLLIVKIQGGKRVPQAAGGAK
ncbi:MAG TPA: ABC transporter substrate-binding protein [Symbiobacteriaceae bacterium]|jgi:branched-chain amino acid transport system substrate-binding protein